MASRLTAEVLRERNNIDFTGIEFIPFEQQTARSAAALNFDLGAGIRDTLPLLTGTAEI